MRLKMAVLAPMPRVRTATAVKPGDLRSMRNPLRASWARSSDDSQPHAMCVFLAWRACVAKCRMVRKPKSRALGRVGPHETIN
jgi:hypothetical protein